MAPTTVRLREDPLTASASLVNSPCQQDLLLPTCPCLLRFGAVAHRRWGLPQDHGAPQDDLTHHLLETSPALRCVVGAVYHIVEQRHRGREEVDSVAGIFRAEETLGAAGETSGPVGGTMAAVEGTMEAVEGTMEAVGGILEAVEEIFQDHTAVASDGANSHFPFEATPAPARRILAPSASTRCNNISPRRRRLCQAANFFPAVFRPSKRNGSNCWKRKRSGCGWRLPRNKRPSATC